MSKPYITEIEVLILYVGRSEDQEYEIELRWYDGDSRYCVYNHDGKYLGTWRPKKNDDPESIEDSDLLELLDTYAPHKASA